MSTKGTKHLPKFYLHFTYKYQQCITYQLLIFQPSSFSFCISVIFCHFFIRFLPRKMCTKHNWRLQMHYIFWARDCCGPYIFWARRRWLSSRPYIFWARSWLCRTFQYMMKYKATFWLTMILQNHQTDSPYQKNQIIKSWLHCSNLKIQPLVKVHHLFFNRK
jgi:hypothetical protein